MLKMEFKETGLKGVYIIKCNKFKDDRGSFVKIFNETEFSDKGLESDFKESFYTVSKKGVIRGMHFQIPPADHTKLVYVVSGRIRDVVVDLRKSSSSFGKSISVELSSENGLAIYIPKGFAHGFEVLSDSANVIYMASSIYSPEHDNGILWNSFDFDWSFDEPIISERDKGFPRLNEFESPFN